MRDIWNLYIFRSFYGVPPRRRKTGESECMAKAYKRRKLMQRTGTGEGCRRRLTKVMPAFGGADRLKGYPVGPPLDFGPSIKMMRYPL
jgi:hypothetical protein